ncbi:MAG TPA: hypothetical protein VIQ30_11380, partial [Pseudonocardia sp.]
PLIAAGATPHLSFKTNPVPDVLAWAAQKPAGLRLLLTMDHEPEQQKGGDPTVEEFHAGWAELLQAFDGRPMRDEMMLGPVYTRYWWQEHPGDLRWLVREPVDFHGWDVYSDVGYRTPDDLLTIPRQVAEETGLPYLIAELGALPGPGRAGWMRAMVDAVKADGGLTCCWYHKDGWDLTSAADQQTWQTIIREETPVATTAPDNLLAARRLLLDHLDMHPGKVVSADLDPAEVGIVGDPNHRGGYHCGSDRVVPRDYSVIESARDRTGLAKWASALDVGTFSVTVAGKRHDLPSFSVWLVAQCKAGTPDTRDIREVIYSPDGKTVKRWDRLGKRTTGDSSHLFHTHISYFRDSTKAGRDQTPLFRRYLTTIGLIKPEDDVSAEDVTQGLETVRPWRSAGVAGLAQKRGMSTKAARDLIEYAWAGTVAIQVELTLLRGIIETFASAQAGGGDVDTAALMQRVDQIRDEVVDELAARLVS